MLGLARRAARAEHPVVGDRVVLFAAGRVAADGPPDEVLTPRHLELAYAVRFEVLRGEAGLIVAPR